MPTYTYEIGASTAAMSNVENILTSSHDEGLAPVGMAVRPHSYYHEASSGREYGDGYPWCEWRFDGINQTDKNTLDAYLSGAQSASLYIKTRKEDGTYATYSAIMHRPKYRDEGRYEDGIWQQIVYRFTMLVLQS